MYDHGTRKDIELFDYVKRTQKKYDDEKIFRKLYPRGDKNSFYRLKNRLIEDVNESLVLLHYRKDDRMYILHLLSLLHFYFSKNQFDLAWRFIKKAEEEAARIENYELLDVIYGEYIALSHELAHVNPEEYIRKRKENRDRLNSLRQMDDILAAVRYRLKITQNFSEKETSILKLLEETMNDFSNDANIKNSPKLRFKIYAAASQVLLQKHDYTSLEKYSLATYSTFSKERLFNKSNHDTKLQMLTYIVNSLFKNRKHEFSLEYAEQLNSAMHEYGGILYDKYQIFYYNSLVINYSIIDKDKAIHILEELRDNKKVKRTSFYDIIIEVNLAVLWFDKQNYLYAIRNLNKLYLRDSYKDADEILKFKIAIAELIIRYELKDFDLLEHKKSQFKKDYRNLLKKAEQKREVELLSIMAKMMKADSLKGDQKLQEKVKLFVKNDSLEDTEIIKYNAWLKASFRYQKASLLF